MVAIEICSLVAHMMANLTKHWIYTVKLSKEIIKISTYAAYSVIFGETTPINIYLKSVRLHPTNF
jgi:hypothetical protein